MGINLGGLLRTVAPAAGAAAAGLGQRRVNQHRLDQQDQQFDMQQQLAKFLQQRRTVEAGQQDADRQRTQTLQDAQNAENGLYLGAAPTTAPVGPGTGADGFGVSLPSRYEQVGGAYVDRTRTPEARQVRQQQAAQATAEALYQRNRGDHLADVESSQNFQRGLETAREKAARLLAEYHTANQPPRATGGPAAPGNDRVNAKAKDAQNANEIALHAIDRAIAQVQANPDAFGLSNMAGGTFLKDHFATNPANIGARATVGDLSSVTIHDRTGAAMGKHEWDRLKAFIPTDTDNATTALTKLQQFRARVLAEQQALQTTYGGAAGGAASGSAPPPAPAASHAMQSPADLWEALVAKGMAPDAATREVQATLGRP